MKNNCIIFLSMTFMIVMFQQVNSQTITWQRAYDINNSPDAGFDVIETFDSNYVICGYAGDDLLLMKLNKFGLTMWTRLISSSMNFYRASALQQTPDSGFIITGDIQGDSLLLLKTNKVGDVEWKKAYTNPGSSSTWGNSVKITSDNGYIACGVISYVSTFTLKGYVVKTDNKGNLQWSKEYDSLYGSDIFQTPDNNYFFAGGTSIRKINSVGEVIWKKNLGSTIPKIGSLGISRIIQDNNFIYASGGLSINGGLDFNMYLGKIDTNGNVIWEDNYLPNASASDLCQTSSGKILLAGTVYSNTLNPVPNVAIVNVSQDGSINYVKRINAKTKIDGEGYGISNTKDNGFIICGATTFEGTGFNTNLLTIKCDSLGGTSSIVNIFYQEYNNPLDFQLYQNFPNPFNPNTEIKFTLNNIQNVELVIHDVSGKLIEKVNYQLLSAGNYSYIFNARDLSTGIYFYSIQTNNYKATKKMLLIK